MTALTDLATRVRVALGVAATFEATTITDGINRTLNRLLRDYNFPKSARLTEYVLAPNDDSFVLPDGFKKTLLLRWVDPTSGAWSDPLRRREGIQPPNGRGYPKYWWQLGLDFKIDTPFALEYAGQKLQLYWQDMAAATNLWMLIDFEDVVFSYSVYRLSADFRKPEVMQAFSPLWAEDQRSLAIYANELEFDQLDIIQHEAADRPRERYPIA